MLPEFTLHLSLKAVSGDQPVYRGEFRHDDLAGGGNLAAVSQNYRLPRAIGPRAPPMALNEIKKKNPPLYKVLGGGDNL
ncbi:MAG: hypothetical protein JJU24_18710, partial [Natronohydrobacter sp.]|nr:hypothetical protein [Natronohydrobacter sp.]